MNKPAAQALLGKVYTFMQRFNEAIPLFNASLDNLASAAAPTRLYDYNKAFATGGVFLPIGTFGPTMPVSSAYEENIYARPFSNVWRFISNEIFLSPDIFDLFDPADLRLKFYTNAPYGANPFTYDKFRRKMAGSNTEAGVLVPDIYLLNAECKARTGDTTSAKADLLTLRTNRMPATAAALPSTGLTQLQWIRYILDERKREFAVDGFRWFDMRRLSVDPLFSNTVYTHKVYSNTGAVIKTIPLRPERFTLRIPPNIMEQNPGMENNP